MINKLLSYLFKFVVSGIFFDEMIIFFNSVIIIFCFFVGKCRYIFKKYLVFFFLFLNVFIFFIVLEFKNEMLLFVIRDVGLRFFIKEF